MPRKPSGSLFLFADRLPPLVGGMETHAAHFMRFFRRHERYPLRGIVTKDACGRDVLLDAAGAPAARESLADVVAEVTGASDGKPVRQVLFFNSGRWIEALPEIRGRLPRAVLCQRTGGNEVIQARLDDMTGSHAARQVIWARTINRHLSLLVSNSRFTDARLCAAGIDQSRIERVSGGVDSAAAARAIAARATLRARWFGALSDRPVVVVASRHELFKGIDTAIRAVALARTRADVTLVCAGDGSLRGEHERLAADLLGPSSFLFLGPLSPDESLEVISAANVVCALSRDQVRSVPGGRYIHTETMGRTVLEALCTGVPVVASRAGALPEFVPLHLGLLVPTDDSAAAASAIVSALE